MKKLNKPRILTRRAALVTTGSLPFALAGISRQEAVGQTLTSASAYFETRAEFVAWVAQGNAMPDGQVVTTNGLQYIASTGAAAISDLPSWLPSDEAQLEHWPVVGDGETDDAAALTEALQYCITHNTPLKARQNYGIGSQINLEYLGNLLWDFRQAKFTALPGFPGGGTRMFSVVGGKGIDQSFEWIGGHYDGRNQPREGSLSSNDILNISVGGSARVVRFHPEYLDSGEDWRTSGGDSHLIINADNIDLDVANASGAQDLSIYVTSSSKRAPTRKSRHFIRGNFSNCRRAVAAKRGTATLSVNIVVENCQLGWASSPAKIEDEIATVGADTAVVQVVSRRCEVPISDALGNGIQYHLSATEMGVFLPEVEGVAKEYMSREAYARFSGSKRCQAFLNIHDINPELEKSPNFKKKDFMALKIDVHDGDADQPSEDNQFIVNCSGLNSVFVEEGTSNRNVIIFQGHDIQEPSRLSGEGSRAINLFEF